MAYAEKRGKGPRPWRVKYKLPNGEFTSESGFETKRSALDFGRSQEARVRSGTWTDQRAGQITLDEWIELWMPLQDVGISTVASREYLIRQFVSPEFGSWPLASITTEDITRWEKAIPSKYGVAPTTAKSARAVLCTILGDAAGSRPPRIPFNPALRPRNRGKRTGRKLSRSPQRPWATPLEALLVGERAALLSGTDDDFVLVQTLAYTGMRWGEAIGLEREFVTPSLINVEWQLRELGAFHRLPPKDDSYRSENWDTVPLDLPPFLASLLATHIERRPQGQCPCVDKHGGTGMYVFGGPRGGHYRRGRYAELIFRPSCDGRYLPIGGQPGRLVIVDASAAWPGTPVAKWPAAVPGEPYVPPAGRGLPPIMTGDTASFNRLAAWQLFIIAHAWGGPDLPQPARTNANATVITIRVLKRLI
jgi:integrase